MRRLILMVGMIMIVTAVVAQQHKRSVILINGTAYIADLAPNGSILQRYQSIPQYFNLGQTDEQIIADAERRGLSSQGAIELYAESLDSEIIPDLNLFRRAEDFTADGERQYIAFSRDRALLNQQAVDQIRAISTAYTQGKIKNITVHSYHRDTEKSRVLASNRAEAIKNLLETFGMDASAIDHNLPYGVEDEQLYYVYLSFGE